MQETPFLAFLILLQTFAPQPQFFKNQNFSLNSKPKLYPKSLALTAQLELGKVVLFELQIYAVALRIKLNK